MNVNSLLIIVRSLDFPLSRVDSCALDSCLKLVQISYFRNFEKENFRKFLENNILEIYFRFIFSLLSIPLYVCMFLMYFTHVCLCENIVNQE